MLQATAIKVPHLSHYTVAKYQWLIQFAIGPHSIYIQVWRDPDKQWIPLAYKVTNEKLDAIVKEWPAKWCNPMSQEELSKEPPADAPDEPVHKKLSVHESNNELSMNPDPKAQHMREETQTKWHLEYDVGSGTLLGMEDQLKRLIKAVTDSSEAAMQAIRESNQEAFVAVRDKLNSIYDVVSRKTPKKDVMQEFPSISTDSRARNIQVPSTVIDAGREEVNQLLRPLHSISLDLNKLPTQVFVELQHVSA